MFDVVFDAVCDDVCDDVCDAVCDDVRDSVRDAVRADEYNAVIGLFACAIKSVTYTGNNVWQIFKHSKISIRNK